MPEDLPAHQEMVNEVIQGEENDLKWKLRSIA